MAFSTAISGTSVHGNHRVSWGTWTNSTNADSGGAITTGLNAVFGFSLVPTNNVGTTMPNYSASAGTVTLVTDNGVNGNWYAFGI